MKKKNNNNIYDIEWDKEPVKVKAEEYFKYFDVGNLSDSVAINTDVSSLYIMSHKELWKAIDNDISDENGELILFDKTLYCRGTFTAYVISEDMPELAMKQGDIAILDISGKHFSGEGLYVLNVSGQLKLCFVPASDETDFLIIEAKVCEVRRRLTDIGRER